MTTRSQSAILVLMFAAAMAVVALIPRPAGAETREEIALRIERISEEAHQLQQRIDKLQGKENAATADLQRKEARRKQLEQQLVAEQARSKRLKKRLAFAKKTLSERIVTVYKEGEPDVLTVVLESDGFAEMVERTKYLKRIADQDQYTINRVTDLKADSKKSAAKLDELEERQAVMVAEVTGERNRISGQKNRAIASAGAMKAQLKRQRKLLRQATAAIGYQPGPDTVNFTPTRAPAGRVTLNGDGTASAPANAPASIKAAVAAGNRIAKTPYIWGGGHGSFSDKGYDCSGSVSYVLHAAGVLGSPLASGGLMSWGKAGQGNWITVYSNPGHVFMTVGGLRFDTSGRSGTGSRWQSAGRGAGGFAVRHYPGL